MISAILAILLYLLIAVLCLELIFWIVSDICGIPIPPKIRKLLYAIVALIVIGYIVQVLLSGSGPSLPWGGRTRS